jgi:hypothetical protein
MWHGHGLKGQKFFGSFFQKRTFFSPSGKAWMPDFASMTGA